MTRQQDMEPMAALAGAVAAVAEAARYTGDGMRTAGRRAARASGDLGRRTLSNATDAGRRANVAFHVYRGNVRTSRRRPAEYVTAGAVVGVGTLGLAMLVRGLLRRPDGGPGVTQVQRSLDAVRALATRAVRNRSAAPGAPDGGASADEAPGVSTIPRPAGDPSIATAAAHGGGRRSAGAAS